MSAEEVRTGQGILDLLKDAGQQVFFPTQGDNLCVPSVCDAAQDISHP